VLEAPPVVEDAVDEGERRKPLFIATFRTRALIRTMFGSSDDAASAVPDVTDLGEVCELSTPPLVVRDDAVRFDDSEYPDTELLLDHLGGWFSLFCNALGGRSAFMTAMYGKADGTGDDTSSRSSYIVVGVSGTRFRNGCDR
jgi:hypothetical protein